MIFGLALAGCAQQGEPPSAAEAAAQANADNSAGVLNVADAAIAGNNPDMALKVSQSVLAADPKNVQALYHEAQAYYALGRCEDAIAAYRVALGIDPKSSEAETGIGRCLLKHNAAEAELAFNAAVQDDPGNAAAQNDLGIALDLQGKYGAATKPYEQALLLDPGVLATEVNLGMSLALSGDANDALEYLGPLATGAEATPKIREDYAAALVAAGNMSEANQVLSVDLPPDQVTALLNAFSQVISASQTQPVAPAAAPTSTTAPVAPVATQPIQNGVTPAAPPAPVTTQQVPTAVSNALSPEELLR